MKNFVNKFDKIPVKIIHYSKDDPLTTTGGVQSFAKGLNQIFQDVEFMTPKNLNVKYILTNQIPVICDNQMVSDIPEKIPVIGFQHGVGAVKYSVTGSSGHRKLRRAQKKASKRPNTIWVSCADWIAKKFEELYGNKTSNVIYHHIDTDLFDGNLNNENSKLILHDARTVHKGLNILPIIEKEFHEWKFESLNCHPNEVPDRMKSARAFIHLSKYEGNSIVCNEAMAMDLPCMFTTVGLLQDSNRPSDVYLIDADKVYTDNNNILLEEARLFINSLKEKKYNPRKWILNNATSLISYKKWMQTMIEFQTLSKWVILPTK